MPPRDECKNYVAMVYYANRGTLNGKQSKGQPKGENWEAHDFSVHLRVVITLSGEMYCCTSDTWKEKKKIEEKWVCLH